MFQLLKYDPVQQLFSSEMVSQDQAQHCCLCLEKSNTYTAVKIDGCKHTSHFHCLRWNYDDKCLICEANMKGVRTKLGSYYYDALKEAIDQDDASAIANLLISKENDKEVIGLTGILKLFDLCLEGNKITAAKALIDYTVNTQIKKQFIDKQKCVDGLLQLATKFENRELISYLLAANANPMYGDSGKESGTLTLSTLKTEPDIFYELLTHVELKNLSLAKFSNILIRLLLSGHSERTVKLIEKVGSQYFLDLNESGHPMLIHLMHEKLFGQIETLICIGKDLNIDVGLEQRDTAGFTPLMHAVMFQREKTVKLLINTKVKVDALSADGKSALHLASSRESEVILQALIDAGGDVSLEVKDTSMTPLYIAELTVNPKNCALILSAKLNAELRLTPSPRSIAVKVQ